MQAHDIVTTLPVVLHNNTKVSHANHTHVYTIAALYHFFTLSNMEVAVMMTGSSTEKGFIKIPIVMELEFGRKGLHVSYINFSFTVSLI